MNWRSASSSSKEIADASDLSVRAREISARIAALRSGLESDNQSDQTTPASTQPLVATSTEELNNEVSKQKDLNDLNDLKAKLLGKMK